ncbi:MULTISPECIES: hypothetical protein [Acinetobacter calcoaceticus/baumannii complex]|nr:MULTISPECIES: hypothetical protein [Acinetobacter calcoaceticus/baumannii complex]AOP62499.1 hypothetical protein DU202_01331 [Acinetobacter baumannii DU202]ENW60509.1 hypothetical protein F915_02446 [Acinetobacter baumannii NIPH 70]KZA90137.1 hypothetical protein LV57_03118 [Acinetobacter baumannii]MCT9122489.1 hypothetical protein [Acinetobacter baumannii]MCU6804786.1 hypothetical protein [Acinetobacter baumannii]
MRKIIMRKSKHWVNLPRFFQYHLTVEEFVLQGLWCMLVLIGA